jgi:hypothetical protein
MAGHFHLTCFHVSMNLVVLKRRPPYSGCDSSTAKIFSQRQAKQAQTVYEKPREDHGEHRSKKVSTLQSACSLHRLKAMDPKNPGREAISIYPSLLLT